MRPAALLMMGVISCSAFACGDDRMPAGAAADAALPALTVGVSSLRISLPVMLADSAGLFARDGLRVTLQPFETAQPMMDAVAAGHLDAAGYVAFPISAAAEKRSGRALRHLGVLLEDAAHPISRFLARTGSGVKSAADLAGRRVGILPTAAYRAWLELLLRAAAVDPGTVEVVPLAPPMTAAALASGLVDAVLTNDPAATAAIAAGAAAPLDPEPRVESTLMTPLPFGSFVVGEAWAAAHPVETCALARALDAAVDLATADRAAARRALAAHLPTTESPLVERYPDALYRPTSGVRAEELDRIVARYVELAVLPPGSRAVPADLAGCAAGSGATGKPATTAAPATAATSAPR